MREDERFALTIGVDRNFVKRLKQATEIHNHYHNTFFTEDLFAKWLIRRGIEAEFRLKKRKLTEAKAKDQKAKRARLVSV